MSGGKGSAPRPFVVPVDQFTTAWQNTFPRREKQPFLPMFDISPQMEALCPYDDTKTERLEQVTSNETVEQCPKCGKKFRFFFKELT